MDWAIYGALIAAALAVAGAAALLAVRLLEGWRALKRARRQLAHGLAALADGAERTSESAERVSDQRELEASLARLRVALAQANVLGAALAEAAQPLRAAAALSRRS